MRNHEIPFIVPFKSGILVVPGAWAPGAGPRGEMLRAGPGRGYSWGNAPGGRRSSWGNVRAGAGPRGFTGSSGAQKEWRAVDLDLMFSIFDQFEAALGPKPNPVFPNPVLLNSVQKEPSGDKTLIYFKSGLYLGDLD